jgi:cytochrome c oxidase cbb3-type subunit 3
MAQPDDDDVAERERPDAAARDGIGEHDHVIPFWFNAAFVGTIAFAIVYVLYHQLAGWTQARRYETELAQVEARAAALRAARPSSNPHRGDAAAAAEGAEVFATICAVCHKADGSGLVGPSLVDPYWKYGSRDAELFDSVSGGRPGGMPPWGAQLGDDKVWKVLAYLDTLPKQSEPGVGAPGAGDGSVPPAAGP